MPIGFAAGVVSNYMYTRHTACARKAQPDMGAFSDCRRNRNQYASFDVNTFVAHIVENMKEKHREYENTPFKSFTRFKEKCDFIDNVIFPVMRACSDNPTDENKKAMVDAFKEGVKRFTTFGNMSGIARIFESAYFAMTIVENQKPIVSAKLANFEMSDETKHVVCGDQSKEVENEQKQRYSSKPVIGVVAVRQNSENNVVTGVPVVHARFFNMMRSVRVPQHSVGVYESQDGAANEVMERTPCNA